jgi:hypothetical protein
MWPRKDARQVTGCGGSVGGASSAVAVRRRPRKLGLWRVGSLGRPTRVLGGSSGYQGRAGSHWFSMAASRTARSLAALMAGGRLLGCLGARGRKGRGVLLARRCGSVSPSWPTGNPSMGAEQRRRAAGPSANGQRRFARRRVCIGRVAPA